jgi:Flp pilus assembly protein TadD
MKRIAFLLASAAWGADWMEFRSAHFTAYTDAGKGRAEGVLGKLEFMREHLGAWGRPPLPVKVYLFRSERDFRPFRQGESTRGLFQSGPEADFIILQDSGDAETPRAAAHEYVHLMLHHVAGPLARWQEEGLAEFHSTARPGATGEILAPHLQALARGSMTAEEIAAADRSTWHALLYPQSWAMVHLLHAAQGDGFRRYVAPPFAVAPPELAAELVKRLPGYLKKPMQGWRTGVAAVAVEVTGEPMERKRAALALSEVAFATGRLDYAQVLLSAHRSDPDVAHEFGLLALARHDEEEAIARFERAVKLPRARAQSFFELAMLLRDRPEGRARVRGLLEETVGRNPAHGEAHFLLGQMAAREGRQAEAIRSLENAVAVLPRQSSFWHQLALSQYSEGRVIEARRSAERALAAAADEGERERARAAIELTRASASVAAPAKPPVTVPEAWRGPRGDRTVEGELREVVCSAPPKVRILADGVMREFNAEGMRAAGEGAEFACGAQPSGRRVRVEIDSASGRAVRMEFR